MDIITSLNANFGGILQEKQFPKHHMLHKEGSICNHLYFIKKGNAQPFSVAPIAEEVSLHIYFSYKESI